MHRTSLLVLICAALLCGFTVMASASLVTVNVDLHARNTPVTLTVQDADVNDVLSALFNATDNMYSLQTGIGISGKVASLQLTDTPFADAVKAVLNKANPKFLSTPEDGGIFQITNPDNVDAATPVPTLYQPVTPDDTMVTIKVTLPILVPKDKANANGKDKGKEASAAPAAPTDTSSQDSLLSDAGAGDAGKDAAKPTTEECYLAMIKIHNQPVHVFAVGFDAQELPDFSTLANPNGSNGSSGYGYGGISSAYGTNSPYGSSYGVSPYGSSYGSSYPYGSTGYGSSYPYGTTGYGTSYPYGTTGYGTSYPYGTTTGTTGTTTTTTSKVV